MVSIEISMPRATWTSDLPSISLSDDIIDRYMTCKCDRYMTVTAFDPTLTDPPPGSCTPLQVAAPPSRSDL